MNGPVGAPILDERALEAIEALAVDPARTCIFADFDGTLAPIVDDPTLSIPLPGTLAVLDSLSENFLACAVVSGRPALFLRRALEIGSRPTRLQAFGLYGSEHLDAHGVVVSLAPNPTWQAILKDAALALEAAAIPGVRVELKEIAATLNWRIAPDRESAALALAAITAERTGLTLQTGRMSAELLAPHRSDKGAVVRTLAVGAKAGCFLGDDVGDLPGFDALATLAGGDFTAVRVAIGSTESPIGLIESADLVLDGPPAALEFLRQLALTAEPNLG